MFDDQPVTLREQRYGELHQRQRGAGVHREDAPQPRHVQLQERAHRTELGGVVDKNVQAAKFARRRHHPSADRCVSDITVHRDDRRAVGREFVGRAGQRCDVTSPNHDGVATRGENRCDHPAESAARASHDCYPLRSTHRVTSGHLPHVHSIELQVHLKSSTKCETLAA